jgi:hypothetical protein
LGKISLKKVLEVLEQCLFLIIYLNPFHLIKKIIMEYIIENNRIASIFESSRNEDIPFAMKSLI